VKDEVELLFGKFPQTEVPDLEPLAKFIVLKTP